MAAPAPPAADDDPLALIYDALYANAEAVKANTAQLQALCQAVTASQAQTDQRLADLDKRVAAIRQAVKQQASGAKPMAAPREDKINWMLGGIIIGFSLGALLIRVVFPAMHRLWG